MYPLCTLNMLYFSEISSAFSETKLERLEQELTAIKKKEEERKEKEKAQRMQLQEQLEKLQQEKEEEEEKQKANEKKLGAYFCIFILLSFVSGCSNVL